MSCHTPVKIGISSATLRKTTICDGSRKKSHQILRLKAVVNQVHQQQNFCQKQETSKS
jgi:hypothetical protein